MTVNVAVESQQDNKVIRTDGNHQKALQKKNDSNIRSKEMLKHIKY